MSYSNRMMDPGDVIIPVPESYHDCMTLARSDYNRIGGNGNSVSSIKLFLKTFYDDRWAFQFYLRMAAYEKGMFRALFSGIRFLYGRRLGCIISPKTPIGFGLVLGHGCFGIVINPETVIGNNCLISQFVNIGSNDKNAGVIGDCTYIGPMVCVVDEVHIGSNVTIGAGAVVVKDIPSNATAVGVPAKPINFENPGRYIGNKWML